MNKEIFSVTRDDYVGFLDQIRPDCRKIDRVEDDNGTTLNVYSIKTNKLRCSRYVPKEDGIEEFYVIEMPDDDERCAPRPKQKIVLETREEVQAFFDILNKIQHGETANDGTVS